MNKIETNKNTPDWEQLNNTLSEKYNVNYAYTTIFYAKAFIDFKENKEKFASTILEYTEAYLYILDYKIVITNAQHILKYSSNKEELKIALEWCRMMLRRVPENNEYKMTIDAIMEKVKELTKSD
jgi:hypothetical protein